MIPAQKSALFQILLILARLLLRELPSARRQRSAPLADEPAIQHGIAQTPWWWGRRLTVPAMRRIAAWPYGNPQL
jgi:hypothetical protein